VKKHLVNKNNFELIVEIDKRWLNHKLLIRFLSRFFEYVVIFFLIIKKKKI